MNDVTLVQGYSYMLEADNNNVAAFFFYHKICKANKKKAISVHA
jgi:hypothetical protein